MSHSVFDDIYDDDSVKAANLTARATIMIALREHIREQGWAKVQAARVLGVSESRVSDLMNGKIDQFSLDALASMLPAVGLSLTVTRAL